MKLNCAGTHRDATPGQFISDAFARESRAVERPAESIAVPRGEANVLPDVFLQAALLTPRPHLVPVHAVDRFRLEDPRPVELSTAQEGAQEFEERGGRAT